MEETDRGDRADGHGGADGATDRLHPPPVLLSVSVDAMIELTDLAELTVAQTGSTRCRCCYLCRWKQTDGRDRQR